MASAQKSEPRIPRWIWVVPLLIVSIVITGVWAIRSQYPSYKYRFRMTVGVDVDGELRSSSSVIEVQVGREPRITPEMAGVSSKSTGDAVFVDLPDGKNVTALLTSGPIGAGIGFPATIVPKLAGLDYSERDLPKFPTLRGRWELSPEMMPTFVTFSNVDDPSTAQVVQPSEFSGRFGPAIRLHNVTIEMTDEPVVHTIEQKMPWIKERVAKGAGGVVDTRPGEFVVNVPYFMKG